MNALKACVRYSKPLRSISKHVNSVLNSFISPSSFLARSFARFQGTIYNCCDILATAIFKTPQVRCDCLFQLS